MSENTKPIKKRGTIRTRLLIVPIVLVIITIAALGGISTLNMRSSLLNEMSANGQFVSQEFVNRIGDNTQALVIINKNIEDNIRSAAKTVGRLSEAEMSHEIVTDIANDLGIDQLNLYGPDGFTLYSNTPEHYDWGPDEEHPLYDFFFNSNEEEFIEEIRVDSIANVLYKHGTIRLDNGYFVQAGIEAEHIYALTEEFSYQTLMDKLGENEGVVYAVFTDTNFEAIAHSIEERIGLDLSDDAGTISAISDGEISYSEYLFGDDEIPVYDVVYPVVVNGELIGALNIGFSMENINSTIRNNIIIVVAAAAVAMVVLGFALFTSSNYVIRIIHNLRRDVNFMAEGDFSWEVPKKFLAANNEFGEIFESMEIMQSSMKNMIKNVMDKSQMVAAHSQELTATTEESTAVSNEISEVIESIATGASEQAKDTESGLSSVNDLGKSVDENINNIQFLNNIAEKVDQIKNQGLELMTNLLEKTDMSNTSTNEIKYVVGSADKSVNEIAKASGMISSIADQTNLLALNASIEAARAGEAGKGFAVVAEEIRKLAEDAGKFTEEINNIISGLTEITANAVDTMEELEKVSESQSISVNETSERFQGISDSIEAMKNVLVSVNDSSDDMNVKKDQITEIIEHLSTISEENAAGTEEASASVEEQTAAMLEISSSSQELARIAEELNNEVEKFKI